MVLVESEVGMHFTLWRAIEKHGFEEIVEPQVSISMIIRNLKMEAHSGQPYFCEKWCVMVCPRGTGNSLSRTMTKHIAYWERMRAAQGLLPFFPYWQLWAVLSWAGPPAYLDNRATASTTVIWAVCLLDSNPRVFSDLICEQWLREKITELVPITMFSVQISFLGWKRVGSWWHLCSHRI